MTVEEKALALVKRALDYADGMICRHDNCERGGVLWTICQDCGAKWADDTGGFKPSPWPEMLDVALADADAAIEAHEADKKAFSDAVERTIGAVAAHSHDAEATALHYLSPFILPEPEPDPLVEAIGAYLRSSLSGCHGGDYIERLVEGVVDVIGKALAARGYKIERIEQ